MLNKVILILMLPLALSLIGCGSEEIYSVKTVTLQNDWTYRGDMTKNGEFSAAITNDRTVKIWNNKDVSLDYEITQDEIMGEAHYLDISNLANKLAIANPGVYSVWDLRTGKSIVKKGINGQSDFSGVSKVTLSPSGNIVALGFTDGVVVLHNITTDKLAWYPMNSNKVNELIFSDDESTVFSGGVDGTVVSLDLKSGQTKKLLEYKSRITSLAINRDMSMLFVSDATNNQVIFSPQKGDVLVKFSYPEQFRYFRHSEFSQDGITLFTGTSKNGVYAWNAKTGSESFHMSLGGDTTNSKLQSIKQVDNNIVTLNSVSMVEVWKAPNLN